MRSHFLIPEALRGYARTARRRGGPSPATNLALRLAPAALACGLMLGAAGNAVAQSDQSMQAVIAKLNRLEADLNSLQRNVYRGTIPDRPESGAATGGGDIGSQLYTYEESLRRLTAQVEELAHQQRQMEDRLARLSEDAEFRLQEIEGKLGLGGIGAGSGAGTPSGGGTSSIAGSGAPDPATPAGTQRLGGLNVDPDSGTPRGAQAGGGAGRSAPAGAATAALTAPSGDALTGSPRERYNASLRLIRVGQLSEAEAALQAFLKDYPNDALAGNAQYWLGETYYARNEYEQAAAAFLAGYRNHPKSQKAPDNLLKLGVSLVAMGQKAEACPVFDNLLSEFPNAPRLILDRARSEKQRAGC